MGRCRCSRYLGVCSRYTHAHTADLFADEVRIRLEQLHRAPRGRVVPPRGVHVEAAHLVRARARARARAKARARARARAKARARIEVRVVGTSLGGHGQGQA